MKTLYQDERMKFVDNEQGYDYMYWIDNFTDKTLVITFRPGDFDYDEENDDTWWHEDEWEVVDFEFVDEFVESERLKLLREEAELNMLEIIEIEPQKWAGFLADNEQRSMANAVRKHLGV